MARYTMVFQLDDDFPEGCSIQATSPRHAIQAGLAALRDRLAIHPSTGRASLLLGRGDGTEDEVSWVGAWQWNGADGYVWTGEDPQ